MSTPLRKSTRRSIAVIPSQFGSFSPANDRETPKSNTSLLRRKVLATPKTPLVLSKEPEKKGQLISEAAKTPKTKYANPIMAKIQRDLNSPSATARIRATKALKSPTFCSKNYGIFDVPHEQQDLITEEERAPIKHKTNEEIFASCKVYVTVRTDDDNRSAGVKAHLSRHGVTINEKLYKDTTHVIFKDGLLSTYKNAIKQGCAVTTVLWFEECLKQRRLVDPSKFKIANLDRYENPELYKRIRRPKEMQPDTYKWRPHINTPTVNQTDETLLETPKNPRPILETTKLEATMDLTLQNEKTIMNSSMDIENNNLDMEAAKSRRLTSFTPNPMELTRKEAIHHRRSLFVSRLTEEIDNLSESPEHGFSANSGNTIAFNSHNKLSKNSRRSVFEVAMNRIELNCKAMSQLTTNDDDISELTPKSVTENKLPHDIAPLKTLLKPPTSIRKRKLFNHESFIEGMEDEFKENPIRSENKKQKLNKSLGAKPASVKKRTTLQEFFKTEKTKPVLPKKTPTKRAAPQKYIVITNMSSTDKAIIHAAIENLGGRIENEVTSKTTHVVSPNIDRTMNLLRGVIRTCPIVSPNWIHDSIEANKWLETSSYQHDIVDSHRIYERTLLAKNYQNSTFMNQGLFYINEETIDNAKKIGYIKEIVLLCSGSFTENKSEARFIISDRPTTAANVKQNIVDTTFVFDSAMKWKCLEASRYLPKAGIA